MWTRRHPPAPASAAEETDASWLLALVLLLFTGCATDWRGTYQALDGSWVAQGEAPEALTLEIEGTGDPLEAVLRQGERRLKLKFRRQDDMNLVCDALKLGAEPVRFPRQGGSPPRVSGAHALTGTVSLHLQHRDDVQGEGHLLVIVTHGSGVKAVVLGRR